jgi:hypothetical protein
VIFSITVDNTSPTNSVTIDKLRDSIYGNLDGVGSCSVPKQILASKRYSCTYDGQVFGDAGFNQTHRVIAKGADEYGNPVSGKDSTTVKIIPPGGCLPYTPEGKNMMICW